MSTTDRQGNRLVVGDLVTFQFANHKQPQHATITAIGPPTDGHATLKLAGSPDIDSLSVQKIDAPPKPETTQHFELFKGPTTTSPNIPVPTPDPWDTIHQETPLPKPQPKPKRAPASSHKKSVKPTDRRGDPALARSHPKKGTKP